MIVTHLPFYRPAPNSPPAPGAQYPISCVQNSCLYSAGGVYVPINLPHTTIRSVGMWVKTMWGGDVVNERLVMFYIQ